MGKHGAPARRSSRGTPGASRRWASLVLIAVAVGSLAAAFAWFLSPSLASIKPAVVLLRHEPTAMPVAAGTAPAAEAAGTSDTNAARAPAQASSRVASRPPAPPPRIPRTRDPEGDLTPDLADYINEGERPTMAEVIQRLHQAGIHSGLGAFSPPGTRPPLVGLAVPEGFELPDGYVRHHQATDDGQPIEPILMFAPDRRFFDAAGRPLAIPADRVVPPEMAPPGLPIRRVVIPAPVDAAPRGG